MQGVSVPHQATSGAPPAEPSRDARRVWAGLLALGGAVLALQFVTLPKLQDLIVAASSGTRLENVRSRVLPILAGNAMRVLGPSDFALLALFAACVTGLAIAERRDRALSRFVARFEQSSTHALLFLLLFAVVATRYYLNPGDVFMQDSESLGIRAWMVSELLRQHHWPVWSNYWYMGFPLMHYYGPLYFVVVGAATLVVGNFHLATKLVLWAAHIGSIFAMFFFLRAATRRVSAAVVGAMAYGLVFYRTGMILYSGDVNLNFIWLFYPLLFLAIETYFARPLAVRRNLLSVAGAIAALILTHHAYAFFGLIFAAVYVVVRVATWETTGRNKFQAARFFGVAAACGLAISAFSLIPFAVELRDVRGLPNVPYDRVLPAIPSLHWLLMMIRWAPAPTHSSTEAYFGASLVVLAVLSAIYIVRTRHSPAVSLLVAGVYAFTTVRAGSQYGPKNLNFVVFFISALVSFAPAALATLRRPAAAPDGSPYPEHTRVGARLAVLVAVVILVDLGPLTFQNTFRSGYYATADAGYEAVLAIDKNYRVLERRVVQYDPAATLASSFEPDRLGIISAYLPIQSPLGRMNEESARSISYNAELIKNFQLDLNDGTISDLSLKGLLLMNVRFLVFRDRSHFFPAPLAAGRGYSVHGSIVEFDRTRPLVVSTRVVHACDIEAASTNDIEQHRYWDRDMLDYRQPTYDTIVRPLIETMQIDLDRGTAGRLVLRDDREVAAEVGDPAAVRVSVDAFDVTIDTVRIGYEANMNAYGLLPFSYLPYLDVRIDQQPVSFFRSAMHTIVLPLPTGRHVISVNGRASPLRKWMFVGSMFATALILVCPSRVLEWMVRAR